MPSMLIINEINIQMINKLLEDNPHIKAKKDFETIVNDLIADGLENYGYETKKE